MPALSLDHLRHHALARSLFAPTTLPQAIARLGFVQADPIRAPARAQDLTLRHRVRDYRAGDLEARYPRLALEEDFFVNYGFLPRATWALMHPRQGRMGWTPARWAKARAVLEFVRARGVVHPREVEAEFRHGSARNWFGGRSNASTQLLDGMHYRGLLRVARREGGTRLYAAHPSEAADVAGAPAGTATETALDTLADVIVRKYAPLPERSLSELVRRLRYAAPHWTADCGRAVQRAKARLPSAEVGGLRWYWPEGENPASRRHAAVAEADRVRLLAPFDPVVWDRRRFEAFWGWAYRFEAYVPAPRRVRGYYALPLLWRDRVVGWANLAWREGVLAADFGFVDGRAPRERTFAGALEDELARLRAFLSPRRLQAAGRAAGPSR